jgi:hypothetical protein
MRLRPGHFVLVILLTACGGSRLSKQSAERTIESTPEFKTGKLLYLPRVLAIPADGIGASTATREGEALNIIQIASIDPVVAVLRARDRISIEDFVSAVPGSVVVPPKIDTTTKTDTTKSDSTKSKNDSTKAGSDSLKPRQPNDTVRSKPKLSLNETHTSPPPAPPLAQSWVHTLRVTPRATLQGMELAVDDGEENPEAPRVAYGAQPVGRTPGWTLSIGAREFMRVLEIAAYTPTHGEPRGDTRVDFIWRWRPTKPGALFDTESAEFESLPRELQQAALTGAVTIDASTVHWARATLERDGGSWKVTSVNWAYGDDKPHDKW